MDLRTVLGCCMIASLQLGCSGRADRAPTIIHSHLGVEVSPTLEDRKEDGSLYTSATQSLLREKHSLEDMDLVDIEVHEETKATFTFRGEKAGHSVLLRNIPLDLLVPRLHYQPASPPDDFDAYNLMMSEFSRNGLSVPKGDPGDSMAHFESDFADTVPWGLESDYVFKPNASFIPLRFGVINNCLSPCLWEFNATDRAGELYHAWFKIPDSLYYELISSVNGVPVDFSRYAVQWNTKKVRLALDRLRTQQEIFDTSPVTVLDESPGFSSQDSRQKLERGFLKVDKGGRLVPPGRQKDFLEHRAFLSDFIEPGKYSASERKELDFAFLFDPKSVETHSVLPHTHYDWNRSTKELRSDEPYLEFVINLAKSQIIIGNLPLKLLVEREDYQLPGFGVGILTASSLAERRAILIREGHHPSFAYLAEERDGNHYAMNSHDLGIEQIFIRARPNDNIPSFEVVITSFERIADIVKYRFPIPESIRERVATYSRDYIAPAYFTYRDDNIF